MHWKKMGVVWKPDGRNAWAMTHAMIPTPIRLNNEVIRNYSGCWCSLSDNERWHKGGSGEG